MRNSQILGAIQGMITAKKTNWFKNAYIVVKSALDTCTPDFEQWEENTTTLNINVNDCSWSILCATIYVSALQSYRMTHPILLLFRVDDDSSLYSKIYRISQVNEWKEEPVLQRTILQSLLSLMTTLFVDKKKHHPMTQRKIWEGKTQAQLHYLGITEKCNLGTTRLLSDIIRFVSATF